MRDQEPSKSTNPLQPVLILFPLIFYITTFISYLTYQIKGDLFWFHLAYIANVAGVLTALVAMVPAITAWWAESSDHPYEKKEGMLYTVLNWVALVLFIVNLWNQAEQWQLRYPAVGYTILISGLGLISAFIGSYFGWDLEQKYEAEEITHSRDNRKTLRQI